MTRVRTAWVARQSLRELLAFLRQRAWHFTLGGNYAIATDYVIRLLNHRARDPVALVLGEIGARHTRQETFGAKCQEAQRRLCAQNNATDVLQLVTDEAERERLRRLLLREATDAADGCGGGVVEEKIVVCEKEPLVDTQAAVRIMAQRVSGAQLVELQQPRQSVYGRGIYALARIDAGTAVMADQPFVVTRMRDDACAHCLSALSKGSGGVPCAHCGRETYCSAACRDAAWRESHVCCCATHNAVFASWEEAMRQQLLSDSPEESRAALCCLAVAKLCAMATVQQVHPLALPCVRSLRGCADYDATTALSEVGALAVTLARALRQTHLYMEDVLSLFALVQTNEFLLPSGMAVYHGYSFLNHSCEPNSALVGSDAMNRRLVTVRDVREGEQLFINYNASLTARLSYEDRRALCQQRHFECFCQKCVRKE